VGPREILDGGRYGRLVPIGDPVAMAQAIQQTLEDPPDRAIVRARAQAFSFSDSIARYEEMLTGVAGPVPQNAVPAVEGATPAPQLIQ
jgi:glycosyltransferase involved in cell wall biosynthesis